MSERTFKDLIAWQKSMDLACAAYALARQLPGYEKYALSDQIRRSSVSVASNLAEGQKRSTTADTKHFCAIALGSVAELETQLLLIDRNYFIDVTEELALCQEVSKLISGLIRSLNIAIKT